MQVDEENTNDVKRVLTKFKSDTGEELPCGVLDLPVNVTVEKLELVVNTLLQSEEPLPFAFYIDNEQIVESLEKSLKDFNTSENVVEIVYQPQAIFKVRAVTRCTGTLEGHKEPVLSVSFSPNGHILASGSADHTLRLWDVFTQTPVFTCTGHENNVLYVAWSPCGTKVASASQDGKIIIWNPETGKQIGKEMKGHKNYIDCLSWEPYHINPECRRLVSASKDKDLRIWDTTLSRSLLVLAGHTDRVTFVRWGGRGLIYSASRDKTIKVWRAEDGILCRTLEGHAHWVNVIALNVDYVLRIGSFRIMPQSKEKEKIDAQAHALKEYEAVGQEKLVSGSDDFTLFLWSPEKDKKPITRMTGHQQLINDVKFSPDGRLIASASFDKSIKLWDSNTGKYIATLRGHVQRVYQISWSADSRLLVSGSADSTIKVWNIRKKELQQDLPGHADEVYALDWAPDGIRVASGGKDKILRLWQN